MLSYGQGNALAFEVLYRRHKDSLFSFLFRSCQSATLVEDIAQEAWTSIIRNAERYEPQAKFKTWLFGIAKNKLTDHWRRNQSIVNLDEDCESTFPKATPVENPESLLENDEARNIVKGRLALALNQLSMEQRDVFLLREEGFTHEEMASIVGVGRETVKSRLRYASTQLRKSLDPNIQESTDEK